MLHHPLAGADGAEWLDKGAPALPGWNRRRSPLKDHDTLTLIGILSTSAQTRFSSTGDDRHSRRASTSREGTEIWTNCGAEGGGSVKVSWRRRPITCIPKD